MYPRFFPFLHQPQEIHDALRKTLIMEELLLSFPGLSPPPSHSLRAAGRPGGDLPPHPDLPEGRGPRCPQERGDLRTRDRQAHARAGTARRRRGWRRSPRSVLQRNLRQRPPTRNHVPRVCGKGERKEETGKAGELGEELSARMGGGNGEESGASKRAVRKGFQNDARLL